MVEFHQSNGYQAKNLHSNDTVYWFVDFRTGDAILIAAE